MIRRRSAGVIDAQEAISRRVLMQPVHSPVASSMAQILTQGLSMAVPAVAFIGSSVGMPGT